MKVLTVRNVQEALPLALEVLYEHGAPRKSRNGPVLQYPMPVSTVYLRPSEKVIFWPERDANPFFHLYESLWMLAGRNDLAPLQRYVSTFGQFSDDGKSLHGAYGYRWRKHFADLGTLNYREGYNEKFPLDQLKVIAGLLMANRDDRRAVLGMWDPTVDLGGQGKDLPCNDTATFQVGTDGRLHLCVFCRSNDIVWGAYGANAVHFAMLLEYMAAWTGIPIGTYTQISINWHGYVKTIEPLKKLIHDYNQCYATNDFSCMPITGSIGEIDEDIHNILDAVDNSTIRPLHNVWAKRAWRVLQAHSIWKADGKSAAINYLNQIIGSFTDWEVAAVSWLSRRSK